MIWLVITGLFACLLETRYQQWILSSEVTRLRERLSNETDRREQDITFIEDYFDRCGCTPQGRRVHCGTVWCSRPDGHVGDCK